LERGDRGGSNGGGIVPIGVFLMKLYWQTQESKKLEKKLKKKRGRIEMDRDAEGGSGLVVGNWYRWKEGMEAVRMVQKSAQSECY
jgi:hypothetical protein